MRLINNAVGIGRVGTAQFMSLSLALSPCSESVKITRRFGSLTRPRSRYLAARPLRNCLTDQRNSAGWTHGPVYCVLHAETGEA